MYSALSTNHHAHSFIPPFMSLSLPCLPPSSPLLLSLSLAADYFFSLLFSRSHFPRFAICILGTNFLISLPNHGIQSCTLLRKWDKKQLTDDINEEILYKSIFFRCTRTALFFSVYFALSPILFCICQHFPSTLRGSGIIVITEFHSICCILVFLVLSSCVCVCVLVRLHPICFCEKCICLKTPKRMGFGEWLKEKR